MTVAVGTDMARWSCETWTEKWDADQTKWAQKKTGLLYPQAADLAALRLKPVETIHIPAPANRLTTVGLNALTARLVSAVQVWDNTHVGLAIGDSSTADSIGDTDMVGATNKYYQVMDATYPTQANGVLTLKSTYGSGIAEGWAWNEYGAVVNSGTATAMAAATSKNANYSLLNRKSPAGLGTKGTSTIWAFTMTITIV